MDKGEGSGSVDEIEWVIMNFCFSNEYEDEAGS